MHPLKYTLIAASLLALTSQASNAAVDIKLNVSCPSTYRAEQPCPLQKTEHTVILSKVGLAPFFIKKAEVTAHGDESVGSIATAPTSDLNLFVGETNCGTISSSTWQGKTQLMVNAEMDSTGKVEKCTYSFK